MFIKGFVPTQTYRILLDSHRHW